MADTTISGTDPRRLVDRDDSTLTLTSGGPPPKKASSSSTDAQPALTGPTAYDVKDVAKYMPVTPVPMDLSLDAQKAAVDKRLASPTDYPKRKYDEALQGDLARRILDRDTQAKAAAKEAQCPSWAACQPVPKGYDPAPAGWVSSLDRSNGEVHGTLMGTTDGSFRVGAFDAKVADHQVDVSAAAVKAQTKETNAAGVTQSTTVQVGAVGAHAGKKNADGSTGFNAGAGYAVVSGELTLETKDGASATGGLALGYSHDMSTGVKASGATTLSCTRVDEGPATVGACVPVPAAVTRESR